MRRIANCKKYDICAELLQANIPSLCTYYYYYNYQPKNICMYSFGFVQFGKKEVIHLLAHVC